MEKESAVFIDGDGTLNEEVGYIREPEQVKLFDTSTEDNLQEAVDWILAARG